MRGKRSKQYRKLMQQYGLHFAFREPYQVLVDAAILQDAARFKMDFVGGLSKALHGQIKPMITQCCIRHLYDSEPKDSIITQHAKGFERRRCNHHELEKPLSSLECITSVVDPKGSKTNKHRYVVACQDEKLRSYLRTVPGVPLIYLKRSVMIMEPMAGATEDVRAREERAKFRTGLKGKRNPGGQDVKQKKDGGEQGHIGATGDKNLSNLGTTMSSELSISSTTNAARKKRKRGPSGPNPLSMKKSTKKAKQGETSDAKPVQPSTISAQDRSVGDNLGLIAADDNMEDGEPRRKRKRRHKSGKENNPAPGASILDTALLDGE